MDGYEDAIIRMRSDKPAAIGCSYLTLDRLEQFLEAGEILNSYCRIYTFPYFCAFLLKRFMVGFHAEEEAE